MFNQISLFPPWQFYRALPGQHYYPLGTDKAAIPLLLGKAAHFPVVVRTPFGNAVQQQHTGQHRWALHAETGTKIHTRYAIIHSTVLDNDRFNTAQACGSCRSWKSPDHCCSSLSETTWTHGKHSSISWVKNQVLSKKQNKKMKLRQNGGCLWLERPLLEKALRSNIHENVVIFFFPSPSLYFFCSISVRVSSLALKPLPARPREACERPPRCASGTKQSFVTRAWRR